MRFEKGHKAATRRHIIDVASKCVRRDGISAAGIAGIMGEAGLTKGAFSPHFESKDALVREALASALSDQQHRLDEDQRRGLALEGRSGDTSTALTSKTRRKGALRRRCSRKSPASPCPLGRTTSKRCEATFRRWPHYFRMPILQRAGAARPPSSASWWALSSSRGPSATLSRRSRSWKVALRPRCSWRELHLPIRKHRRLWAMITEVSF